MSTAPATLAYVLRPCADALTFLTTTKVHSTLFPYPWAPTLHAARISMAYQANMRRTSSNLSWGTYLAGYLVMCWGGMVISHSLLSMSPPILYSIHPYINYLSTHLVLTAVFNFFPQLLTHPALEVALLPIDALLRTNAVTSTVSLLHAPASNAVDPKLSSSPLFHIILGAVASAGGGVTAATLKTWTPEWSFGTPVFLRNGAGVIGSLDVWGGSLVAVVFSMMTQHPAFDNAYLKPSFALSALGAKAVTGYVFTALFGYRVWRVRAMAAAAKKNKAQ
ncbi:hypothetical protein BDZ89DRAFT_1057678 [Hymenopellis radicata]|nr:hypothetical protein BDZ89DRAFT_1057678 [Hymenopellis radicata]